MVRKAILLFLILSGIGSMAHAQVRVCGTDLQYEKFRKQHPEVDAVQAQLETFIKAHTRQSKDIFSDDNLLNKTTGVYETDTSYIDIPCVFHIIHNYGKENIADTVLYNIIDYLNSTYNLVSFTDTQYVYPEFKKYIGMFHIRFHLAKKDPNGNPTKGITRRVSQWTYGLDVQSDDEAKYDLWAPSSYYNMWIKNKIGQGSGLTGAVVLAYTTPPSQAAVFPYSDGAIFGAWDGSTFIMKIGYTLPHETGHYFNLQHPWGNTNSPCVSCGDDGVDDTPPTKGHFPGTSCGACPRADTACLNYATIINKSIIDTTTRMVVDSVNGKGLDFVAKSHSWINTVGFYPGPGTLGKPYGVAFTHYNYFTHNVDTVKKISGTVTTTTAIQTVTINALIPFIDTGYTISFVGGVPVSQQYIIHSDSGYSIVFYNNPGAIRDSAASGYTNKIKGAVYIKNDISTSPNGPGMYYNYFYQPNFGFGYFKIYPNMNGLDSLADYPDTTNVQNIMDYSDCGAQGPNMFTKGQVVRSRASLNSAVGNRNNLWTTTNLLLTGVLNPDSTYASMPIIPPTADFSVERSSLSLPNGSRRFFGCIGSLDSFQFRNQSWNDTVKSVFWTFSNGARYDTLTRLVPAGDLVKNEFSTPGWVSVSLKAHSNGGDNTITNNNAIYVSDTNAINPLGYVADFNPSGDAGKYPMFNYYNNQFHWEIFNGAGYYDNTCMRYTTYDDRLFPNSLVGAPRGDTDDFMTPAFDLTGSNFATNCNLNFMSAGAFRTSYTSILIDSLIISYSTDCGTTWNRITGISKLDVGNNGEYTDPFTPTGLDQWALHSYTIPAAAKTNRTFFRFRFKPGVDTSLTTNTSTFNPNYNTGTGNNFYLDRLNISNWNLGLNTLLTENKSYVVAPNPTTGSSYVIIQGVQNDNVQVNVTDLTGKMVYTTSQRIDNSGVQRIEIPAAVISSKGIYLVHITTGTDSHTEKLVSY
ncbi:MAG: zinc-dependent metalloprotease [Bacteroidota bacterium]